MKIISRIINKFKTKRNYFDEYIERDTKCDTCENLKECMQKYEVIEVTGLEDERQHFICGAGSECKK